MTPRSRNFDTEPPSSYCYELQPDRRWESVANVQTAAGLRVRLWLSIRAEVKALGAANEPSDSMPYFARNGCRRELYANGIGVASANNAAAFAISTQGSESARRFETCELQSYSASLPEKIFIKSLRLSRRGRFFKVLVCALPISS
jgi:hypothetical protein